MGCTKDSNNGMREVKMVLRQTYEFEDEIDDDKTTTRS
jgi:hypothetical protein